MKLYAIKNTKDNSSSEVLFALQEVSHCVFLRLNEPTRELNIGDLTIYLKNGSSLVFNFSPDTENKMLNVYEDLKQHLADL